LSFLVTPSCRAPFAWAFSGANTAAAYAQIPIDVGTHLCGVLLQDINGPPQISDRYSLLPIVAVYVAQIVVRIIRMDAPAW
jgi:hypothetical protein